jgi:glucokinase
LIYPSYDRIKVREEQSLIMHEGLGSRVCAIGLDVGGTKLAAAVVDANGRISGANRLPLPKEGDADDVFNVLVACSDRALSEAGLEKSDVRGVGCGCGGPIDWAEGVVSPINIPAWDGFRLKARLAAAFPGIQVAVHNDAVALAVGEHWQGEGRGRANMLAITVSTGVGGGLILGNQIYNGKSGNAGHIGHIVVDPEGPRCGCGGFGCVESIASGPSAVRLAQIEGWSPPEGVQADGHALARSASEGNEIAVRYLAGAGRAVGLAIASTASLLDLDAVVVGGGFAQSGDIFWKALRGSFERHAIMTFARNANIVRSVLVGKASLLGAAGLVLFPERYGVPASRG